MLRYFGLYLKSKLSQIILFFICALVFLCCFCLYRLPIRATLYPIFLCALLCMIWLFGGFVKLRSKQKELEKLLVENEDGNVLAMDLPEENDPLCVEYVRIINRLSKEILQNNHKSNRKFRELEDYFTVWVHQIKTPIAAMKLKLEDEDNALSRSLMVDVSRTESYVNMVLTYIRLGDDVKDYHFSEYKLNEILSPILRKMSGEFILKKIRLNYEPIEEQILTDEKWLSFVIEQILSNALKYTNEGSISIYMEAPKVLCIKDSGMGIAAADIPRIFEKGFTGVNGRIDKRASGIGLYLCKKICDNLQTCIRVESEVNVGTVVKLDLGKEINLMK